MSQYEAVVQWARWAEDVTVEWSGVTPANRCHGATFRLHSRVARAGYRAHRQTSVIGTTSSQLGANSESWRGRPETVSNALIASKAIARQRSSTPVRVGVKWSQVEILFSPTKDRSSEAVSVTIGAASFVRSKCWKARNTQKAEKARLFGQAVDCHSCGVVARLPVDIACNRGASHGRQPPTAHARCCSGGRGR